MSAEYLLKYEHNWGYLDELGIISFDEIATYEEPVKMYLYAYFGYKEHIKKNYNLQHILGYIDGELCNFMFFCIYINDINLLKWIKTCGFDINYYDSFGDNAYLEAAYYGKIKIMKYLESIEHDVKHRNFNNSDAYLISIMGKKLKVMKYLINKGITSSIDYMGLNDFSLALISGNIKILTYLVNIGRDIFYRMNNYKYFKYDKCKYYKFIMNTGYYKFIDTSSIDYKYIGNNNKKLLFYMYKFNIGVLPKLLFFYLFI
jgi:hypothetical protein